MRKSNNSGFTLIELLVVISIIGFLATAAMIGLDSSRKKARDAKRKADITIIASAMNLYAQDNNGTFPVINGVACLGLETGLTCWGDRNRPGNTALINSLSPYIKNIPTDPIPNRGWGDRYLYLDTSTSLTGCNANFVPGKYILWRPDDAVGASMNCLGKGVWSCCGTGGAPCGNNGGHYCAFKFD